MTRENEFFKKCIDKVPIVTPLREEDPQKRKDYAENGPILNGGEFGCVTLSDDWETRRTEIGFLDDKPWWLDSSSVKNRYWYAWDEDDVDEAPEVLKVDKHIPHFMNLCGICWNSRVISNWITYFSC